jgi:CRP-like cAMP-binding protein
VREGELGDRLFVVAEGELEVLSEARSLGRLQRGDSFGEIALLRDVPRTATVPALTEARLYALGRAPFLAAVTAHPEVTAAADRVVGKRLAAGQATIAP